MNPKNPCINRTGAAELSEEQWSSLLATLQSFVLRLVCRAHLNAWKNQELDVALDITYTAIRRVIEYIKRAKLEGFVIGSLEGVAIVTARRLFLDTLRKDARQLRGEAVMSVLEMEIVGGRDMEEQVLDRLEEEALYKQTARMVMAFPAKTRTALLEDIASRLNKQGELDGKPTPLRSAFEEIGVRLEEYLPLEPATAILKSRRTSLASLGYKRIASSVLR